MFTVKHIFHADPTGPHVENLYEADDVQFFPTDKAQGALQLRRDGVFLVGLWGGMAYVMNETGKTVARYDLPRNDGALKHPLSEANVDPEDYPADHPEHADNQPKVA